MFFDLERYDRDWSKDDVGGKIRIPDYWQGKHKREEKRESISELSNVLNKKFETLSGMMGSWGWGNLIFLLPSQWNGGGLSRKKEKFNVPILITTVHTGLVWVVYAYAAAVAVVVLTMKKSFSFWQLQLHLSSFTFWGKRTHDEWSETLIVIIIPYNERKGWKFMWKRKVGKEKSHNYRWRRTSPQVDDVFFFVVGSAKFFCSNDHFRFFVRSSFFDQWWIDVDINLLTHSLFPRYNVIGAAEKICCGCLRKTIINPFLPIRLQINPSSINPSIQASAIVNELPHACF